MGGSFERTAFIASHFKTAPLKDNHFHRPSRLGAGNHFLFDFFLQLDHTFPNYAGYADILDTDRYRILSRKAVEWFLGRNIMGTALYEESTGACRDGLSPKGANQNMGAESTAVCLMALLKVHRSA